MRVFLVGFLLATAASVLSQFSNPKRGDILTLGGEISVLFKTKLQSYNIALWQQAPEGGTAILGPVVLNTTEGPVSSFRWKVDAGRLDLAYSKKFFFWLFPNGYAQGNQSAPNSMSSGYFTITERTPDPTTTSSVSAKPSATSSTGAMGATNSPTTSADPQQSNASEGAPSTGAKAGIGAGIGVGVLVIIALSVMFFRYKSKKEAEIQKLRYEVQDPSFVNYSFPQHQPSKYQPAMVCYAAPFEMAQARQSRHPVELG